MRTVIATFLLVAYYVFMGSGMAQTDPRSTPSSLRQATHGRFEMGVGVNDRIPEQPQNWDLLTEQFSIITPENCMKPQSIQRTLGIRDFSISDRFVEYATENKLRVVGHCLVWAKDDRTYDWYYKDGDQIATKEVLLSRMREDIQKIVSRYKGRIAMWDVVNEALDDGDEFLRPSGWVRASGDEFIAEAFRAAHAADPDAILIYNDYNNELPKKRDKMLRLIASLQAEQVPLHAIGLQGHYEIDQIPFQDIEQTIVEVKKLGLKVVVSELDIDMIPRSKWWAEGGKYREELAQINPYADGIPAALLSRQAEQYATLFRIFAKHSDAISRVSFWNLHDGESWLNDFPWKRVNHPLLFDRGRNPKPAYHAVLDALRKPN